MKIKRLKPGDSCNVECEKHGIIRGGYFKIPLRNEDRTYYNYCPHCVEELILNNLKPFFEF